MAPKGVRRIPSLMGGIVKREIYGNISYRVQVSLTLDGMKKTVHGPLHGRWVMAKRDLEHAQTASNHQEMDELLRALGDESKCRRAEQEQIDPRDVKEKCVEEDAAKNRVAVRFMRRVDEIRSWVVDHAGQLPNKKSRDASERTLASCYVHYKMRCEQDLLTPLGAVNNRKFVRWERIYFDRIEEAVRGCKSLQAEHYDREYNGSQSSINIVQVEHVASVGENVMDVIATARDFPGEAPCMS